MAEGIIGLIGQFQKLNKDPTPVALIALTRLLGCGTYKEFTMRTRQAVPE
ncbi:hypothetical protein BIW11_04291 [Tropilaelaps mercedesae]|uniref:Uncharacterized protein n=1 Tax=Tropilaelaps mercedesae TaxID=418985 RepID=A0A1V9X8T3_9ACAR|nr:hypothetical protein BIW11_04291 [Tropilaelaps mercedesae]